MGMPEMPQNGMNIAPDGTIYEILEDGTIKRIGKVSPDGSFEPFGGVKEGIREKDGIIYRVINGKEVKIGRILPNGEIETINQRIKNEAEISRNKVKIVTILSILIALAIGAGLYIFDEQKQTKEEQRKAEAEQFVKEKQEKENMAKQEEYDSKIKPVYSKYLGETAPTVEKLESYIVQLNNLLKIRGELQYEENRNDVKNIIGEIEARRLAAARDLAKAKAAMKTETKKAVVGKASVGRTEIDGAIDSASVAKTIKGSSAAVKRCYDKALLTNSNLQGIVYLTILINEKGRVESIDIAKDTLKDAETIKCIKGVVGRLRFPKPEGGPASVTFPFAFSN